MRKCVPGGIDWSDVIGISNVFIPGPGKTIFTFFLSSDTEIVVATATGNPWAWHPEAWTLLMLVTDGPSKFLSWMGFLLGKLDNFGM